MKSSVTAVFAAIILTSAAYAQAPDATKHFKVINCSALKGQPQVCLFNDTDSQVTDIDCETRGIFSSGSKAVEMPKGGIPPHSMTIVNMKSCHTALIFTILGGGERKVSNVNTDTSTVIEVPKQ